MQHKAAATIQGSWSCNALAYLSTCWKGLPSQVETCRQQELDAGSRTTGLLWQRGGGISQLQSGQPGGQHQARPSAPGPL